MTTETNAPRPTAATETLERHPHWASPLVHGWMVLVTALVFVGKEVPNNLDDLSQFSLGSLGLVGIVVVVVAVLQIVGGFISWRTTRFRITPDEVRIDRNFIQHDSDRLALSKIQSVDVVQPFAARIVGLASLHIDVGAGESKTIEFLSRAEAYRLRDTLMSRARSAVPTARDDSSLPTAPSVVPSAAAGSGSSWQDRHRDERTITSVSARQALLGALLSMSLVFQALVFAVSIVTIVLGHRAVGLSFIAAAILAVVGGTWHALDNSWNFRLARHDDTLKAVHGVTSLTSRTVPVRRVQGVRISRPLLWRAAGLAKVEVTVLGGASLSDVDQSSVLLPVGDADQVRAVLDALWPGFRLERIDLTPAPRQARWFRWFDLRHVAQGWDEDVIVSRHGWLTRVVDVVPHARVQSVELSQGPLQRLLRLAHVEAAVPRGPVHLKCRHMDAEQARHLVLTEMDRARRSRMAELDRVTARPPGAASTTLDRHEQRAGN